MCKHIRVACLGVGFIYFILETTLFQGSISPQVTSLSDIPESASHRVHLWLTFTKCTGADTKSEKTGIPLSKGEMGQEI